MRIEINTLHLSFVNAYLLKTEAGFFLIDCGMARQRASLLKALAGAGCMPGDLRLVVVTHGDSDHCGNCAYLQANFNAPVAMHTAEAAIVTSGKMLASRKAAQPLWRRALISVLTPLLGMKEADKFTANIPLEEGVDLSAWGLEAQVLYLPGHSNGSIGVLTAEGDLFCGDLLDNNGKPRLHMIDDQAAANASLVKLKQYPIRLIYPGHGEPFKLEGVTN